MTTVIASAAGLVIFKPTSAGRQKAPAVAAMASQMKKIAFATARNSLATTRCLSSVTAAACCCAMTGCRPPAGMVIIVTTCSSVVNTPYSSFGMARVTIRCTAHINAPLAVDANIIQPLCRKNVT